VALAEADKTPVLIFDEIDIGIGGRSGEIIGRKLWALARYHQVICVTHLPQIAAFADAHFNVYKEIDGERTLSFINTLNTETRLKEMALMLGGPQGGETSLNNASDLFQKAQSWIKTQSRNKVNIKKVEDGAWNKK
jgi:DNA repair protein RecN (Recombination protein N)